MTDFMVTNYININYVSVCRIESIISYCRDELFQIQFD